MRGVDPERTRAFFDAIAPRYDRVYARERDDERASLQPVIAALGPSRDVLDLGVGTGSELSYLLDAGHRVTGVDVSSAMLAKCNERARRIPCVTADFWQGLPFEAASFDAVLALFGTLAHPPSMEAYPALLREIVRVLRPRGLFYVEMPTAAWTREHDAFVDEPTGARIEIVAPTQDEWTAWLAERFDATTREQSGELHIAARLRS